MDIGSQEITTGLFLSIIICTHNRPKELLACVSALISQLTDSIEIIIIDSASVPPAKEALAPLLAAGLPMRLHRLEVPGLSLGRNAAIALSTGCWLAFLDDDASPDPEWVNEICELIRRLPANTGAVGLYTYPIWPQGRIQLPPLWTKYLSLVEFEGEEDRTHAPVFVGTNMLMRRQALIEVAGFPNHLSRQKRLLLSGEEVCVGERMRRKGWSIWYSSRPRAGHRIPRERLTQAWFRKRMFWEGVTFMQLRAELDRAAPLYFVARAIAFAPVLFVLSLLDSPLGTRRARAMWHVGIAYFFCAYLMRRIFGAAKTDFCSWQ